MEVIHSYLLYITKDVEGIKRYRNAVKYCNNTGSTLNARFIYGGFFTRTGLERFIKWAGLINEELGIEVNSNKIVSSIFTVKPNECVNLDFAYEIDPSIKEELDSIRLKMIMDGVIFIGGVKFDLVRT